MFSRHRGGLFCFIPWFHPYCCPARQATVATDGFAFGCVNAATAQAARLNGRGDLVFRRMGYVAVGCPVFSDILFHADVFVLGYILPCPYDTVLRWRYFWIKESVRRARRRGQTRMAAQQKSPRFHGPFYPALSRQGVKTLSRLLQSCLLQFDVTRAGGLLP